MVPWWWKKYQEQLNVLTSDNENNCLCQDEFGRQTDVKSSKLVGKMGRLKYWGCTIMPR